MAELTFRPMALEDVKAVAMGEKRVEETPWIDVDFINAIRNDWIAIVGVVDATIVSWAVVMPVLDESDLLTIGVIPEAQRQGVGEATLRAILNAAQARGVTKCHLEVRESNRRAQRLYEKLDFAYVGRRKGYYRLDTGREDALLMTKTFDAVA